MKIPPVPHRWTLEPRTAVEVQKRLARQVIEGPLPFPPRLVAGLDAAFSPDGRQCVAAVVVWDCVERRVVEQHTAWRAVRFPYVPGLLSFREAPALLAVLRKLRQVPDVLMCDGQGRAHPRRFGIACHLGILCDRPSIGCGKSRLVGDHEVPSPARGARSSLVCGEELLGYVVRTREGCRPLYVSVGHRVLLSEACGLVLDCCDRHRLPEPTWLADRLAGLERLRW